MYCICIYNVYVYLKLVVDQLSENSATGSPPGATALRGLIHGKWLGCPFFGASRGNIGHINLGIMIPSGVIKHGNGMQWEIHYKWKFQWENHRTK